MPQSLSTPTLTPTKAAASSSSSSSSQHEQKEHTPEKMAGAVDSLALSVGKINLAGAYTPRTKALAPILPCARLPHSRARHCATLLVPNQAAV